MRERERERRTMYRHEQTISCRKTVCAQIEDRERDREKKCKMYVKDIADKASA